MVDFVESGLELSELVGQEGGGVCPVAGGRENAGVRAPVAKCCHTLQAAGEYGDGTYGAVEAFVGRDDALDVRTVSDKRNSIQTPLCSDWLGPCRPPRTTSGLAVSRCLVFSG